MQKYDIRCEQIIYDINIRAKQRVEILTNSYSLVSSGKLDCILRYFSGVSGSTQPALHWVYLVLNNVAREYIHISVDAVVFTDDRRHIIIIVKIIVFISFILYPTPFLCTPMNNSLPKSILS